MDTPDVKELKPKDIVDKPEKTAFTILGSLERGIGSGIGGAVNRALANAIGAESNKLKEIGLALGQLAVGTALTSAVKKNVHAANLTAGFSDAPITVLGWKWGQKLGMQASSMISQAKNAVQSGSSTNAPNTDTENNSTEEYAF